MAVSTYYYKTGLTGGAATDLDSIDGDALVDADIAIVFDSGTACHYLLDDDSGAAESSPSVIAPDTNPGTKRWILQNVTTSSLTYSAETVTCAAGAGVASTSVVVSYIVSDAHGSTDVVTLADGSSGQVKICTFKTDGGDNVTVTPTNLKGAVTGVTLENVGESVTFIFDGTDWNITAVNRIV